MTNYSLMKLSTMTQRIVSTREGLKKLNMLGLLMSCTQMLARPLATMQTTKAI